jgi:hypothetical protein
MKMSAACVGFLVEAVSYDEGFTCHNLKKTMKNTEFELKEIASYLVSAEYIHVQKIQGDWIPEERMFLTNKAIEFLHGIKGSLDKYLW